MPDHKMSPRSDSPEYGDKQHSGLGRSSASTGHLLWLRWILATALGATAGGMTVGLIGRRSFALIIDLLVFGIAVGVLQSLVFRQLIHGTGTWRKTCGIWIMTIVAGGILGTPLSLAAAWLMTLALWIIGVVLHPWESALLDAPMFTVLNILMSATCVGVLQQHVLAVRFNSKQGWTWASIIGWSIAGLVGFAIANATGDVDVISWTIGGGVGGVAAGVITGRALVRLQESWDLKSQRSS